MLEKHILVDDCESIQNLCFLLCQDKGVGDLWRDQLYHSRLQTIANEAKMATLRLSYLPLYNTLVFVIFKGITAHAALLRSGSPNCRTKQKSNAIHIICLTLMFW